MIFIGSFLIGTTVAVIASFALKTIDSINPNKRNQFEASVIIIGPWVSYLISESLSLSGIVSILFCGIFMAKYTYPNLSADGK